MPMGSSIRSPNHISLFDPSRLSSLVADPTSTLDDCKDLAFLMSVPVRASTWGKGYIGHRELFGGIDHVEIVVAGEGRADFVDAATFYGTTWYADGFWRRHHPCDACRLILELDA